MKTFRLALILSAFVLVASCAKKETTPINPVDDETTEQIDQQEVNNEPEIKIEETETSLQIRELWNNYGRMLENPMVKKSRAQIAQMKRDIKDTREQLLNLIDVRAEELQAMIDEAEDAGEMAIKQKYEEALQELMEKKDILNSDLEKEAEQ